MFRVERSSETITLPPQPESAAVARRFARGMCGRAGVDPASCDMVVLLTSETVTNAIVHGHSDVRLTVTTSAGKVRVEAGDDNSRHPVLQPPDEGALDGRGVALLEAVAASWGVTDGDYGKVVWFEIQTDVPAPAAGESPPLGRASGARNPGRASSTK